MKINITGNQVKTVGVYALKIGKAIVIEGTKAVLTNGATAVINTTLDNGPGSVKNLKFDDYLSGGKKKGILGMFGKKNEAEELVDVVLPETNHEPQSVEVDIDEVVVEVVNEKN